VVAEKVLTLIIQKYNYTDCGRENINGKRHYCLPDGSKAPSVTTVLDLTKPEEKKKALMQWRKRVGEQRAQQIVTEAANRGTSMHKYLEEYCIDGKLRDMPSNPFHKPPYRMAEVIVREGMSKVDEIWGTEVPLYFPGVYAGTTDLVGMFNNTPAIMDFKQTNKPKKEEWIEDYKLQMAAYALAHNEVHGTEINRGVVLMCVKPEVNEQGQVTKEPQYQQFLVEGDEFTHWKNQWWKRLEQYYTKISNGEI